MNRPSPRSLHLLLLIFIALLVGAAVTVVVVSIFQAEYAKVLPKHTVAQSTTIPTDERQVVQTYNQAAMKQDWATIYATTSKIVVGDASQEQFAQMMAKQAQNSGTISSITATSKPIVKTNSDGIIYFTINEQVVIVKNGISQTQSDIFIFILENGTWKFWFSKKV